MRAAVRKVKKIEILPTGDTVFCPMFKLEITGLRCTKESSEAATSFKHCHTKFKCESKYRSCWMCAREKSERTFEESKVVEKNYGVCSFHLKRIKSDAGQKMGIQIEEIRKENIDQKSVEIEKETAFETIFPKSIIFLEKSDKRRAYDEYRKWRKFVQDFLKRIKEFDKTNSIRFVQLYLDRFEFFHQDLISLNEIAKQLARLKKEVEDAKKQIDEL